MKRLLALLIAIALCLTLGAVTASQLYFANDDELESMAELRGIEGSSRAELLAKLYEYEGLEAYEEEKAGESDITLRILSAESVTSRGSTVIISGNGSLTFTDDGKVSTVFADTVIVDTGNKTMTALENVQFLTDSSSEISTIEADIVSLAWETGEIKVSNATTSTEREDSDGNKITFYTTGELLTYGQSGAMLFDRGVVGLGEKDPHSSIQATSLALLPGSDMFISNAVLKIGRVPVFWFPFFLFPGSRITGNPAFGLSSSNGMFLNTTWEILGVSGIVETADIEASILSLAASDDEGDTLPTGSYYRAREPGRLQQWARDSESYVAVLADAYQYLGINAAVSSKIQLFDKKLVLTFFDGLAVSEKSESYGYDNLRNYGVNTLEYSYNGLSISGSFPFYSDSRVLMDFGNRVSTFSVMSLIEAPEAPEDYTSTITSFTREASLSYTLPSKYRTDHISSFKISALEMEYDYRWDTSNLQYYLKEATVPSLSMTLSGSVFKLSGTFGGSGWAEKEVLDETEEYLLYDPLLYDLYTSSKKKTSSSASSANEYSVELKYTFTEVLKNEETYDTSGDNTDSSLSSTTSLKLNLTASAGNYASLDAIFTPSFYYLYEDDDGALAMTERGTVTTDITFALPFIGLEYRIAGKLLSVTDYTEGNVSHTTTFHPGWDEDTITTHYISYKKAFETELYGTFTPSLKYVLPPLEASIVPGFTYEYGNFKLVFSMEFPENSHGGYNPDLATLSASWTGTYIVSSLSLKYESSEFESSDVLKPLYGTGSFALRTANKNWSITEYADWEYYTEDGYENYFNHLKTTVKIPYFKIILDWQGPAKELEFYSLEWEFDLESKKFQLWKGRLYFALGFQASFSMEMDDPYSAALELEPSITFSIAEFLDFKFSFASSNTGFYEYYDENEKFSFKEMLKDFGQSLDFFGGGRNETNFVFSSASLEVTHYMHDWDLNVKYSAVMELVDDSYQFVPELTIYLRWKILPDLEIDQSWTEEDGKWIQD